MILKIIFVFCCVLVSCSPLVQKKGRNIAIGRTDNKSQGLQKGRNITNGRIDNKSEDLDELPYWSRDPKLTGRPATSHLYRRMVTVEKLSNSNIWNVISNTAPHVERRAKQIMVMKQVKQNARTIAPRVISRQKNEEIDTKPLTPYGIMNDLNKYIIPEMEMQAQINVDVLAKTLEYNDIVMITAKAATENNLTRSGRPRRQQYDDSPPEKRILLIVHGLSVMGFNDVKPLSTIGGFKKLASFYLKHVDKFDIIIFPMANPDGVAALGHNKIWNKNMSPQQACSGVDVDRNFDVGWQMDDRNTDVGSSCSQHYPGTQVLSEIESVGDAVLFPKGYCTETLNDDKYFDLRGALEQAMKQTPFKRFTIQSDSLHNWYGIVNGTSVDYAYKVYGIPFAMEFLMQPYTDTNIEEDDMMSESDCVLEEAWSVVIDKVFNFMYESANKPSTDLPE